MKAVFDASVAPERTKTLTALMPRERIDPDDPDLIDKLQIPRLLRTAAAIAAE